LPLIYKKLGDSTFHHIYTHMLTIAHSPELVNSFIHLVESNTKRMYSITLRRHEPLKNYHVFASTFHINDTKDNLVPPQISKRVSLMVPVLRLIDMVQYPMSFLMYCYCVWNMSCLASVCCRFPCKLNTPALLYFKDMGYTWCTIFLANTS
jgi:hypothetical protein